MSVDDEGAVTSVSITNGGQNFLVGDKITILDSAIRPTSNDGLDAPDVVLEVTAVSSSQSLQKLTDQVTVLFAKVNEIIDAFD